MFLTLFCWLEKCIHFAPEDQRGPARNGWCQEWLVQKCTCVLWYWSAKHTMHFPYFLRMPSQGTIFISWDYCMGTHDRSYQNILYAIPTLYGFIFISSSLSFSLLPAFVSNSKLQKDKSKRLRWLSDVAQALLSHTFIRKHVMALISTFPGFPRYGIRQHTALNWSAPDESWAFHVLICFTVKC